MQYWAREKVCEEAAWSEKSWIGDTNLERRKYLGHRGQRRWLPVCLQVSTHTGTQNVAEMAWLTLYNPALFGPYNTRGGADLPQSFFFFSWTPGWSDLLKNGLRIKFSQKSSIWDPLLVSQSLSSRVIAVWKKKFFPYISALRGNIGTIRKGPPLWK